MHQSKNKYIKLFLKFTLDTRYSLIQPHLQQIHMSQSPSGVGIASTSDATYLSEDEEKCKRLLNERLEKIDRERTQATAMQKNAEKKAKSCEKLLAKASQEPSFMAAINENEEEEDRDVQSPTEALIERIYAENRQKAAQAAPFPPIPSQQSVNIISDGKNNALFLFRAVS